jgi:hypothetical protein
MAQNIPLNVFKTIALPVTTVANTVYTCPAGVTTVVLLAQVSNVNTSSYVDVTASYTRNGNVTRLIANTEIPTEDATSMLLGKLVLEAGDGFRISSSANNSAELTLSILETSNG